MSNSFISAGNGHKMLKLVKIESDEGKINSLVWQKFPVIAYDIYPCLDQDPTQQSAIVLGVDEPVFGPILLPDGSVVCTNTTTCYGDYFENIDEFTEFAKGKLIHVVNILVEYGTVDGFAVSHTLFIGYNQINHYDWPDGRGDGYHLDGLKKLVDFYKGA